jgi:RNA polymerase sigma-70 factor (ECF subfamily)
MSYNLLADDMLVKLLQISDELAFQAIYNRHWKRIYGLAASKIHHLETAEDITQQVFVSLWERRQEAQIKHLEAYLSTAVKYKCISFYESKYAQMAVSKVEDAIYQADHTTEDQLNFDELRNAVMRAMELLPPKTREVFKLSRFESYSIKEIASQLNISEKAVEYHITRSLKIMRCELKDFLQPASIALILMEGTNWIQ